MRNTAKALAGLGLALLLTTFAQSSQAGETPKTGRLWLYGNFTAQVSPNWAFTVMPGYRYELSRTPGPEKKHYLNELFVGPTYIQKSGNFTAKLAVWYYYTGYPDQINDKYYYSHNAMVIPTFEYKIGSLSLSSRTMFHNTLYASVYDTSSQKKGYNLIIREMITAKYQITPSVGVLLADEPFWSVIEDKETKDVGSGFWNDGRRNNRLYAGFDFKLTPEFSVSPQYVYETTLDTKGSVNGKNHYAFVTLSYLLKTFDASAK